MSREEPGADVGQQVADCAAEERHEPPARSGDRVEIHREVADNRLDIGARILELDRSRRVVQRLLAHVERHEPRERSRRAERVEQHARLLRSSRTELHQRVGVGDPDDVARVGVEDRALTPCRVVLRETRDLIEEIGTAVVVKPLRRDVLGRGQQTARNVLFE